MKHKAKTLFWQQLGDGQQNLVLLHGWGTNAEVWFNLLKEECYSNFRLYLIDLPGYGQNSSFCSLISLHQIADMIWQTAPAPKPAIWLGWSLGGLIATTIALKYQDEISALITVSSSPCFSQQANWPGIKLTLFKQFREQLQYNTKNAIKRFLALQTMGTRTAHADIKLLQSAILNRGLPSANVLTIGLEILQTTDIRPLLLMLNKPFLRIYGEIDQLVPKTIIPIIDRWLPNSFSVIINDAAHVPFISHPKKFFQTLINFSSMIR